MDDDRDICGLIKLYLEKEGFEVDTATTGESALTLMGVGRPNWSSAATGGDGVFPYVMVILDIMLPGIDGFEVAMLARTRTDVPILMLSARDADVDKVVGLGVGADDYLTKPFSPVELVARVKAHLRRYAGMTAITSHRTDIVSTERNDMNAAPGGNENRAGDSDAGILEADPVRLDLRARRAWVAGKEVELTAKEFDLLKVFIAAPGQVFTKAQLFDLVWGEDFLGADNTVMVHIRRLRTKIEADPSNPELIKTIWGIGYRFERMTS